MDKICFTDEETGNRVEGYLLEQTTIGGNEYFLVTEKESEDSVAYILKKEQDGEDTIVCSVVEDDTELAAIAKVFAELLEDVDFEL